MDDVPGLATEVRAQMPYVDLEDGDQLMVSNGQPLAMYGWGRKWGPSVTDWFPNAGGTSLSIYLANWHRSYDASTGRFTSPDPMLLSPKHVAERLAQGRVPHAYAYAGNNPIAFSDAQGLSNDEDIKTLEAELVAIAREITATIELQRRLAEKLRDMAEKGSSGKTFEETAAMITGALAHEMELESRRVELTDKLRGLVMRPQRPAINGGGEGNGIPRGKLQIVRLVGGAVVVGLALASASSEASEKKPSSGGDPEQAQRQAWDRQASKAAKEEWDKGNYIKSILIGATRGDYPWAVDAVDRRN